MLDANDNAPEFTERTYKIENKLVEEDTSVITSPKLLVQVSGNTSMLSYWKSDYHFWYFFAIFFHFILSLVLFSDTDKGKSDILLFIQGEDEYH